MFRKMINYIREFIKVSAKTQEPGFNTAGKKKKKSNPELLQPKTTFLQLSAKETA